MKRQYKLLLATALAISGFNVNNANAVGIPTIDVGSIAGITAQIAQGIQTFNQSVQYYQDNINQFKDSISNQLQQIQQLGGISNSINQFKYELKQFSDDFDNIREQSKMFLNSIIEIPQNIVDNLSDIDAYHVMYNNKIIPQLDKLSNDNFRDYLNNKPVLQQYLNSCNTSLNEQKKKKVTYGYTFDKAQCINKTLVSFASLAQTIDLGRLMSKYTGQIKSLSQKMQNAKSIKESTDLQNQMMIATQQLKLEQQMIVRNQEELLAKVKMNEERIRKLKKEADIKAQIAYAQYLNKKVLGTQNSNSLWGN